MFERIILGIFGFALIFTANFATAEVDESASVWKSIELLDRQTKSKLNGFDRFFDSLFQLPSEYKFSPESEKKGMVKQWIQELHSGNSDKSIAAAAYLGMVEAAEAVEPLERKAAKRGSNRLRWVCTRSLGQIGNQSSIPLLIGLLDNVNTNIRVYARVSLAEITGVYYGDDKEKWKSWQSGKTPELCTPTECIIQPNNQTFSKSPKSYSKNKLGFRLPDIYGRIVDSEDYSNVPVLIMSGSCWCGGCQGDAEPFRKFVEEFAGMGLQAIRTVAGDNELAGLEFQKHYRLPFVQLLDTNRSFEKRYNDTGKWTFVMLADRNGKIVSKINRPDEDDWQQLRKILNDMPSSRAANKTVTRDSIAYMPATLERSGELKNQGICDRFPSIACGADGKIYVVFTTNRNGSSDVFIRVFDGSRWSEDLPVAASASDEYDGTVVVDKEGIAWISWVSNAKGKNYDVFIAPLKDLNRITPFQLTSSDDDAMHSRMSCDDKGRIWITYYKWHKQEMISRDKEVYLRRLEDGKWSQEIQISPTDVPWYEDHTEPAITVYGSGAIVAWSWDFHPPNKGYSNQGKTPTIFIRAITGNMKLGNISCVSGKNIDVTPALKVTKSRQIWCAWDSLSSNQRKGLSVGKVRIGRNHPVNEILSFNKPVLNVCSPCFAEGPAGELTLLWSETKNGSDWVLKRADYNTENDWSTAIIKTSGNPRFCSADYDRQGNIRIAYSAVTKTGREIIVDNPGKRKPPTPSNIAKKDASSRNAEAIKKLRLAIDEKYSYRDFRSVDWNILFDKYELYMQRAKTPEQFAKAAARMLRHAKDMHVRVKVDGRGVKVFKRNFRLNYDINQLKKMVPNYRDVSKCVSTGRFSDGIGYILIKSWAKDEDLVLKPAMQAFKDMSNSRALIIDVRPNSGGTESFAQKFAGCFIDKPSVYAKHVYRNANSSKGWGEVQGRKLKPNSDVSTYQGNVIVLMGQENMSSCEAFLLMMKQVPNCKLVGDRSYGSSGNPKPYELGNGVTVDLPSWKALRPDGTCFEGEGIEPDVQVRTTNKLVHKSDRVLEAALRLLRRD